ncbi:cilia- and flagella-associated protein 52 [Austrofundulus limnaeus]|uniref:Cilia- and flagella-associated protein 52 n=1 Tax=Austrofundulus limnaeus TaxID=52670 RepID=A0A2I4AXR1_AUSLI|nr:PREDICTED: cilia- and flagella-associated protein 52 [Austrofundulus limnaeus]
MANETEGIPRLKLEAAIGFNGYIPFGLWVHPDQEHLIYPLGSTVILKKIADGKQEFLLGHTNNVSCISVSKSGTFIASGQVNFMGFMAPVIIWNYEQRTIYAQLDLHKAKVEAIAFSPSDKYLVSLGGQDDGSVVVWNIETKQPVSRSPASASGHCLTVQYSNTNDNIFVSAGSGNVQVWELDVMNRKTSPTVCYTGKLRRIVKCVQISEDDEFIFCGTTTGDILKICLKTAKLNHCGPDKTKFSGDINVLRMLKSGDLLVGTGSGTLALCSSSNFKTLQKLQLEKEVTSITGREDGQLFFIGTEAAQMHRFNLKDFQTELISTSHRSAVKDISIPTKTCELFATCSEEDIRLWDVQKQKEVLRITVPNMTCNALHIMTDGHSFISGWNDGNIRMFTPKTGQLMLTIENAHKMGVTAIAGTSDSRRIVSGGGEGQVHVWQLLPHGHRLLQIMKVHKATVSCIKIKSDDKQCVTASSDGTCVIWDLVQFVSLRMIVANTHFQTVCYHPEEYQIITSGTDRKVAYWEVYEGGAIRELEGSQSGCVNAMHITQDGRHFVTGGDDKLVKVWDYMGGEVTHVGIAHGSSITSMKICAHNRILVSASADGGIMRWAFPHPPSV